MKALCKQMTSALVLGCATVVVASPAIAGPIMVIAIILILLPGLRLVWRVGTAVN